MQFTLISDPRVTALPIRENGDPIVDAAGRPALVISARRSETNPWHTHVRREVLARLLDAASGLPPDVRLCIEEGYRSISQQRALFNSYVRHLKAELGSLPEQDLIEEATKYVARPQGAPPHSTGGAVDLTLVSVHGRELDMGSTSDDTPLRAGRRSFTGFKGISQHATAHRRMLGDVMIRAGFVNYPAEWWHWSYGDQYWAYRRRRAAAIFGAIDAPATSSDSDTSKTLDWGADDGPTAAS